MFRFTAFITCSAAFALAVPAAISVAAPVTPSQSTRPPSAAMSTLAARAKVSGSLSETSFEASRVGSVKLSYSFSKRSKHFRYRLTFKNGSSWQVVNRVKKTGHFKGSHTMTVKKLFAGEPVKVGSYRLKLTADGGSTTLAFTVTTVPPVTPPAVVKPQAGRWQSTSLSGPVTGGGLTVTGLGFTVLSDQATVTGLGFGYDFYFGGCAASGSGYSSNGSSSPIANGQFNLGYGPTGPWTQNAAGLIDGTFDSPTSAHGTGSMEAFMFCSGLGQWRGSTGTFSWTATRQ